MELSQARAGRSGAGSWGAWRSWAWRSAASRASSAAGLRGRRPSSAGTDGSAWQLVRATRRVGRDSGDSYTFRLTMKHRAAAGNEMEKDQEALGAARR
jgi:hypothetical protein